MKVRFHKRFVKEHTRLTPNLQTAFHSRLQLFFVDQYHIKLNNHPLKGKWMGYRSINISGDYRAIYKQVDDEDVVFVTIGSHSNLYG